MTNATPAQTSELLQTAPRQVRESFKDWSAAVAALDAAPTGRKLRAARIWARRLGVRVSTVVNKRSEFRRRGPIVLIDKRWSAQCWLARRNTLPAAAVAHLKAIADEGQLTSETAVKTFMQQLHRWRKGDAMAAIPGYEQAPKGNPPPGWSARNLSRLLALHPKRPVTFRIVVLVRSNGQVLSIKASKLK